MTVWERELLNTSSVKTATSTTKRALSGCRIILVQVCVQIEAEKSPQEAFVPADARGRCPGHKGRAGTQNPSPAPVL